MTAMKARKKVGLALGSGAIRGLAHVGVMKTLLKHNIPIDYLSGTSIGAWIAVFYAVHQDCTALEEKTVGFKKEKFLALWDLQFRGGVIRGQKLEKLLYQWLDNTTFEELEIPTSVIATDLITGQEVCLNTGRVVPAVRASMAIPIMFQPVHYNDMLLVDGGIINPVPDNIVKNMGADVVIAVNLDSYMKDQKITPGYISLKSTASRSLDILRIKLEEYTTKVADVIIEPKVNLFSIDAWNKYFRNQSVANIVQLGEEACEAEIPRIKALLK